MVQAKVAAHWKEARFSVIIVAGALFIPAVVARWRAQRGLAWR